MKRETVINVLLIIAGIVLAIALFGAGVLWKRGAANTPKTLSSAHFVPRDLGLETFAAPKNWRPRSGPPRFRISIPR